jgi:hypothetical protein
MLQKQKKIADQRPSSESTHFWSCRNESIPMHLNKDLREFIELLNSSKVEFLVVGAFAVAWHGYPRFTADIDFFVRPAPENADAILAALQAFGFGSLDITRDDLCLPDRIIQLGVKPNRIDIITSIAGLNFETAWVGRASGHLDGIPVNFIGRKDLIHNKEATGRAKDLGDAEELRKRDTAKEYDRDEDNS